MQKTATRFLIKYLYQKERKEKALQGSTNLRDYFATITYVKYLRMFG